MIPVYINVFNRLTTTRTLCEQIARLDEAEVIIVDNASDYEPLLDWYDSDCPYEVLRLRENMGHHAPWTAGIVGQDPAELYAVTDCDLDIAGVPVDVLLHLSEPLLRNHRLAKVGLSLEINDLPAWQAEVIRWETQFWKKRHPQHAGFWDAWVDTTFAVYRKDTPHRDAMGVRNALRSDRPYTARHIPWYLDCENMDAENANYFATSSSSNSWKPKGQSLTARR